MAVIHLERAASVPPRILHSLGLAVHAAPAADDALDVIRRSGPPDREQTLLCLWCRHAGQGADFGIGELATLQSPSEPWQRLERMGHPHALAGRSHVEADAPAEPGRTRAKAVVPAAARVELADELEQARGGGIEVNRELGDLIAQAIE